MNLQINTTKTEVLYQPSPNNMSPEDHEIIANGETLEVVSSFKYLGSTRTADNRADKGISCRIQEACASFIKPEKPLMDDTRSSTLY